MFENELRNIDILKQKIINKHFFMCDDLFLTKQLRYSYNAYYYVVNQHLYKYN